MINQQRVLTAYGDWVAQMIAEGREAHFCTMMFNPISGSRATRWDQMVAGLEDVHRRILTRTCRNPKRAPENRLPVVIAAEDFPVHKGIRDRIRDIVVNDGQHMHGIWLMPRQTRLEGSLSGEFLNYQGRYAGPHRPVAQIVSDRIDDSPRYVTDYTLKSIKKGRSDPDKIIILPRSQSEL